MHRDWGEVVEVKVNFVDRLGRQLERKPSGTFGLGTVTDPYQPVERKHELSRGALKQLREAGAPVSILTKSDLVLRDLDLLSGWDGAEVGLSIGSADAEIASLVEPGAPPPEKRLSAVRTLSSRDIDTYVMVAPVIPGVNDSDEQLRFLIQRIAEAGARRVMWDKYNPKPLAGVRLSEALQESSFKLGEASVSWIRRVRGVLASECTSRAIQLLDAF